MIKQALANKENERFCDYYKCPAVPEIDWNPRYVLV